jgi:hypothetical protein
MTDLPEALELLSSRVDALEKRVYDLEHPCKVVEPTPLQLPETRLAAAIEEPSSESVSSGFAVVGKAMLGIAGAYLLRALVESAVLPKRVVAGAAIVYAMIWLAGASREVVAKRFAGAIYAGTSALILVPMLWELTLRFNLLTPVLTACVLAAFVALATGLGWKREKSLVASVAYGTASLAAMALSVATHQMVPFLILMLLMTLVCEYLSTCDHGLPIRPLVVVATDVGIWLMIYIYGSTDTNRADYPALGAATLLAPACLLFLLSTADVVTRVGMHRQQIAAFDAVQTVIAFLLAVFSALLFAPRSAAVVLGAVCLILSLVCYAAAIGRFRSVAEKRNFRVFGVWSAALLLAGAFWSLEPAWAAALLGVAALASIVFGVRLDCRTLEFHGVVYLVVATIASKMLPYAFDVLGRTPPARPAWQIVLVAACAALSYAAVRERQGEAWQPQVLHLVPAALAACAVAVLLAHAFLGIAALMIALGAHHVAFLRTLTICAVALGLAYGGAHWHRLEMTRVAYLALAFLVLKLMLEDMRHGRMEFIAASIFLFAVTLIAVPRLTRMQHEVERKS